MLSNGHTIANVAAHNERLYEAHAYPEMPKNEADILKSRYRWLLDTKDHRTLYRMLDRKLGINVEQEAHINIDNWLDPTSPSFDAGLKSSVFHYKPRTAKNDRFELCIATAEMKKAAWAYANRKQIIVDGTFGISISKVLLFIIMSADEFGKGIPLALLMFSAPSGNNHTAAGYDASILEKLFSLWQHSLGISSTGQPFSPTVAITDTDLKERRALTLTFPSIFLLICRFHIRQSWRNHRNKCLRASTAAHSQMQIRLRHIEDTLLTSASYSSACEAVNRERAELDLILLTGDGTIAKSALDHINYLSSYWLASEPLWHSWSDKGRQDAATILRCPIESVVGTTNHLESFNGLLKNHKLQRYKRNGYRMRLDLLTRVLVDNILPGIFKRSRLRRREEDLINKRILSLPGGELLIKKISQTVNISTPVAFFKADAGRDQAAKLLFENKQISVPEFGSDGFTFTCYSSVALATDSTPVSYTVNLQLHGAGLCTCPDFQSRGGACKHMRAALLRLDQLRMDSPHIKIPHIVLPTTESEARLQLGSLESLHPSSTSTEELIEQTEQAIRDKLLTEDDLFEQGSEVGTRSSTPDTFEESSETTEKAFAGQDENAQLYITDEYDLPTLHDSAKLSVDDQSIARVLRDLEHVSPKLSQLSEYLSGIHLHHPELIARAVACRLNLQLLVDALDETLQTAAQDIMAEEKSDPVYDKNLPQVSFHPDKRKRKDILPPSPEKGTTKRHQSYSVN